MWRALVFIGLLCVAAFGAVWLAERPGTVLVTFGGYELQTSVAVAAIALAGFALALARSVGEYGSVIFIAGNLPNVTEIAPLLIVIRLEEFDYDGAVAIAIAMLAISFTLLLAINLIQIWSRRRMGAV